MIYFKQSNFNNFGINVLKKQLEKRKGSKVQIIRSIGDLGEVKNENCTARYTVAQVDTLAENEQGKSNLIFKF